MSKPTIAELEAILEHDDSVSFTILPNGSVVGLEDDDLGWTHFGLEPPKRKPITMREKLGGEYAA